MKTPNTATSATNPNSNTKCKMQRQRNSVNKQYNDEMRARFIDLVIRTKSIRSSAKIVGMNENTAKSIYYRFQREGTFMRRNKVSSLKSK